jgi:hypothetical protein
MSDGLECSDPSLKEHRTITAVVVIKIPHSEKINIPPLYLEDELLRVWGRKPDITYIKEGELNFDLMDALLCSRTLAGSDQDDTVVRLRDEALDICTSLQPCQVHSNFSHDPRDTVAGGGNSC